MVNRPIWLNRIEEIWQTRPIAWLSGVRRSGKTTLVKMFINANYYNCDLPSTWQLLKDPESFYASHDAENVIIFDEIHRLDDPSGILKIGADEYPHIRIVATGSSTLAATKKFKDSLTGRKHSVFLSPVLWDESKIEFGVSNFDHRLFNGGLPEPLLSKTRDESFYAEWIDSYYARDIQELFAVQNRTGFIKLLRLLMRQSGGLTDYTQLAKLSGISLPTVKSHLEALIISHAITIIPPFHGGGRRELTKRPKTYAFDTGFVTFVNGWQELRNHDRGLLWEHLVLDTIRFNAPFKTIFYWRDKSGREIDFVVTREGGNIDTIECKINPDNFDISSLVTFRNIYPQGDNFVVCPHINNPYKQSIKGKTITFCAEFKIT